MIDCGLATQERWNNILADVAQDSIASVDQGYYSITTLYSRIERHYHDMKHISSCLEEFDSVGKSSFKYPLESEVAIWYHDYIYYPTQHDNEERSAIVATGYMWSYGFSLAQRKIVNDIILATRHDFNVADNDTQLVCDIDLAILGKPERIFDEYEANIRKEYEMYPDEIYDAERVKILQRFLDKDMIYYTDFFRKKYEKQARRNIINSIRRIQSLDGMK